MLRKKENILMDREKAKKMLLDKKYDEIYALFSSFYGGALEEPYKENFSLLLEIFFIIKNNADVDSHGFKNIINQLSVIQDDTYKENAYHDIIYFLLETFFSYTMYQKIIIFATQFHSYIDDLNPLSYNEVDADFLSKLYIIEGRAHHKLKNTMEAKNCIAQSVRIHTLINISKKIISPIDAKLTMHKSLEERVFIHDHTLKDQKQIKYLGIHNIIKYLELAYVSKKLDDDVAAATHYDEAIKRSRENYSVMYWVCLLLRGLSYLKKKTFSEIEKSIIDFELAYSDPEFLTMEEDCINHLTINRLLESIATAWKDIFYEMLLREQHIELIKYNKYAIEFIHRAYSSTNLNQNADLGVIYRALFLAHSKQNQYVEASHAIDKAIFHYKDHPENYLFRALLYSQQGKIPQALADIEKSKLLPHSSVLALKILSLTSTLNEKKLKSPMPPVVKKNIQKTVSLSVSTQPIKTLTPIEKKVHRRSDQNDKKIEQSVIPAAAVVPKKPARSLKKSPHKNIISEEFKKNLENKKQRKQEKYEQKKIKEEKSRKNILHEQTVLTSRQIVLELIENSVRISQSNELKKKTQEQSFHYARGIFDTLFDNAIRLSEEKSLNLNKESVKNQEEKSIVPAVIPPLLKKLPENKKIQVHRPSRFFGNESFASLAHLVKLRSCIMSDQEFSVFNSLITTLPKEWGIKIIGSSVIAYFMGKPDFNNDIDLQFSHCTFEKISKMTPLLSLLKFNYKTSSTKCKYIQFKFSPEEKMRSIDATFIYDEKAYRKHSYDPIDITRCSLSVFRDSLGNYHFAYNYKKILEDAFKRGYFNVDLSKNIENLLVRIIKYTLMLEGMLNVRLIFSKTDKIILNKRWDNPKWLQWLTHYFRSLSTEKNELFYKEITQIINRGYLIDPRVDTVLFIACQELLDSDKKNSFAPNNMIFLLRFYFKTQTTSLKLQSFFKAMLETITEKNLSSTLLIDYTQINDIILIIELKIMQAEKYRAQSLRSHHGFYQSQENIEEPAVKEPSTSSVLLPI
jgi:hypothetical protein